MNRKPTQISGWPRIIIMGLGGMVIGAVIASKANVLPLTPASEIEPVAYRIPKIPGGTPLRMAMVHDVIHERYLRHGPAWLAQRNADARKIIAAEHVSAGTLPSTRYLDAMDDLATGLQSLGKFDEAATVMRSKLALLPPIPEVIATQPAGDPPSQSPDEIDTLDLQGILSAQNLSPARHHQYTACADLGTILIHASMAKAMAGDADATAQVREGLNFIHKAVAINPGAHFGREKWQAIAVEHFLAAIHDPELLKKYDLIGDGLSSEWGLRDHGFTVYRHHWTDVDEASLSIERRIAIRSGIARAGISPEWVKAVHPDYTQPMPFDEPVLAIIGMWTMGGGANPHSALALGRIMKDLGQNEIAWNAYERAVELQDHFWPDANLRAALVKMCQDAQSELAIAENPADPAAWQSRMRDRHRRELRFGQSYQKAYQDYEAGQISAGVALDDSHFYDGFFAGHGPIASPVGLADDMIVTREEATELTDMIPCMSLGAGLLMCVAALSPPKRRRK